MKKRVFERITALWMLTPLALLAPALIIAACSAGRGTTPAHTVVSFSPWQSTANLREEIRIQFDAPVAAEGEVGVDMKAPATIVPAIPLRAVYADRQTLVIRPLEDFRRSTAYTLTLLPDGARGIVRQEFRFNVMPLAVTDCEDLDPAMSSLTPSPVLVFNQEVSTLLIEKQCRIRKVDDSAETALTVAVADASTFRYRVRPAAPLTPDTRYSLFCEALHGTEGTEPMAAPRAFNFVTHRELAVIGAGPSGDDAWSDAVRITLSFTTPVDSRALAEAITSDPPIDALSRGTLDSSGREFTAVADLRSNTRYRIQVTDKLKDTFGQTLKQPFRHEFTTGSPRPRFRMDAGIYALEATVSDAYPLWTRNLPRYTVSCAAVPKNRIVKLLTGEMNYDPWYDASSRDALDWKKMGLKVQRTTRVIEAPKDRWDLQSLQLPKICGATKSNGLYLAEISSDAAVPDPDRQWDESPFRRVLANVTDLGVLIKAGTQSGLLWVTRLSTGAVVEGARVTVFTPEGTRVFSGSTDARGLVNLPGIDSIARKKKSAEAEYDDWRSRRLIALVEDGDDMAVVDGNWQNGIQIWNFGVSADYSSNPGRYRGFIQSDRGIYRPGETAHFKGLVRRVELGKAPRVPTGEKVAVRVSDIRGNEVFKQTVAVSRFGGFGFDIPLGAQASTGDYAIEATIGGQRFSESFLVEEFRKVTFEVGLDAKKAGAKARRSQMTVSADYLFGMPVADAQVNWNVMSRRHHLRFDRFPEYSFADETAGGWDYYWYGYGESENHVADGAGQTDAKGRLSFSFDHSETDKKEGDAPRDYLVSAEVQDTSGETIRKSSVVTVHRSAHYLGLHAQEWVQAVGMPFSVAAIAVSPDGPRVAARATVSWNRQVWKCEPDKSGSNRNACRVENQRRWSRNIEIPATGPVETRIVPDEPGEYVVRLDGHDANGRAVAASRFIWVIGQGEAFWSGDESARMALILSKPKYAPGETARVVARASIRPQTALITLERNGIMAARVQPMTSPGQGIEIPVTEDHAPNLFVSVVLIGGRSGEGDSGRPRFQMGVAELSVDTESRRLKIDIQPEKQNYAPGEKVRVRVRTTSAGMPVPAELSVSVADEGVLQLINYRTPDPMRRFYEPFGLGVENATNWNRILRLRDPSQIDPDQGGDSGGPDRNPVRSRFVSSAFWTSALVTDAAGEATFEFPAPDNLTSFRIMTVGADNGARFGSAEERIVVNKKLMAVPLLPRFVTAGDELEIGLEILNRTGQAGDASIQISAQGAQIFNGKHTRKVAADGKTLLRTKALIPKDGSSVAKFSFAATLRTHSDRVELSIPVLLPLIKERRELFAGSIQNAVQVDIAPASAGESTRHLEIELDRSGMARFAPSLNHLIGYPYGCLEQTLSRIIPMVNLKELATALQLDAGRARRMSEFIQAGVDKVLSQQNYDGHFSLWPGGQTYPHLTAYALFGLLEARQAGVRVPKNALDSASAALRSYLNSDASSGNNPSQTAEHRANSAMAAWVLARSGKPDAGASARLYEARAGFSDVATGFLLMALRATPGQAHMADTVRRELMARVQIRNGTAMINERQPMKVIMNSDIRSTAVVLMALAAEKDTEPQVQALRKGLDGARTLGGSWPSTQDNLWALTALAAVSKRRTHEDLKYTVTLNGKALKSGTIRGEGVFITSVPLARSTVDDRLSVQVNGDAELAVRVVSERSDNVEKTQNNGVRVTRSYLKPGSREPVSSVRIGDVIAVEISVDLPAEARYVAVVDALPAGFEPLNTRLDVHGGSAADQRDYRLTYQELRDDQAQAFYDYLPAGISTYTYQVRALTPGVFTAMPARAEVMYEPAINGRTAAARIEVK